MALNAQGEMGESAVGTEHSAQVVVVGGGVMGCAVARALAQRGAKVRVLERFSHVHTRGSHGGFTRVIRHAYHEGQDYLPLIDEADASWEALGEARGERLLERAGLLEFGDPSDATYQAAVQALVTHGVTHESFDAATAMQRWPIELPEHWQASLSPQSGYLRVGACMDALRAEAQAAGARFDYGVHVREVIRGGADLRVLVDAGEVIACDRVVLCAGAYAAQLLPGLFRHSKRGFVYALRRVLAWTQPAPEAVDAFERIPVWGAMTPQGFFYGFPLHDEGVRGFKLACHSRSEAESATGSNAALSDWDSAVDPESVSRALRADDLRPLERFLDRYMPLARGPFVHHEVCMYAQSVDGDFIVDLDPRDERVCVAAGFSGHGFKFAPAIGQLVADLLETGSSTRQRQRFALSVTS